MKLLMIIDEDIFRVIKCIDTWIYLKLPSLTWIKLDVVNI